jgi:hypothetical protein
MTLLAVVQKVCPVVGVMVPQAVFPGISSNRTMQEMVTLANEVAQTIAYDHREWTTLKTKATFTGDGVSEAFNLPANYKRMLLKSNVWRSRQTMAPMRFIPDLDEWMQRRAMGHVDLYSEWTIYGGQMHIQPILPAAETATFNYLDKNCIALASGGYGDEFMSDLDTFRLDERVLKLGMIWRWKSQKGTAYAEDMGTYGDALNTVAGFDQPSPILIGRRPAMRNATDAYPWPVPT